MKKSKKGFGLIMAVIIAFVLMTFLLAILIQSSNGISNFDNHTSQMQATLKSKCALRLALQYVEDGNIKDINLNGITKKYLVVSYYEDNGNAMYQNSVGIYTVEDSLITDTGDNSGSTDTSSAVSEAPEQDDVTPNQDTVIIIQKDVEFETIARKYLHERAQIDGEAGLDKQMVANSVRTFVKVVYNAGTKELALTALTRYNDIIEADYNYDALGDNGSTSYQTLKCKRDISLGDEDSKENSRSLLARTKVDFSSSPNEYNFVTIHVKPYKNTHNRPYLYLWTNKNANMTPWISSNDNNVVGPTAAMEYISDGWYEYTAKFLKRSNESTFNAVVAYKDEGKLRYSYDMFDLPIDSNHKDIYITLNSENFYTPSAGDNTGTQAFKQKLDKDRTVYTVNDDDYLIVNFKVADANENFYEPQDFEYQGYGWYKRIIDFNSNNKKGESNITIGFANGTLILIPPERFKYINEIYVVLDSFDNKNVYVFSSEIAANEAMKGMGNPYSDKYANVNLKLFSADKNTNVQISYAQVGNEQTQEPAVISNRKLTFYFEVPIGWGNSENNPPAVSIGGASFTDMTYVYYDVYSYTFDYSKIDNDNWEESVEFSNKQAASSGKLYKAETELTKGCDKSLFRITDYSQGKEYINGYIIKDEKKGIGSWYDWFKSDYDLDKTDYKQIYFGIPNKNEYSVDTLKIAAIYGDMGVLLKYYGQDKEGYSYYYGFIPADCSEGEIRIQTTDDDNDTISCDLNFSTIGENEILLFDEDSEDVFTVPYAGLSESYMCEWYSSFTTKCFYKNYIMQNSSQEDDNNTGYDSNAEFSANDQTMALNSGYKTQYYNVITDNSSGFAGGLPSTRNGTSASCRLYDSYNFKVPIKGEKYKVSFKIQNKIDGKVNNYTISEINGLSSDIYITVSDFNKSTLGGDVVSAYTYDPDKVNGGESGESVLTSGELLRRKIDEALAVLNNCCLFNNTVDNISTVNGSKTHTVVYENKVEYQPENESSKVYFMERLRQIIDRAQKNYKNNIFSEDDIKDLITWSDALKELYGAIAEARRNLSQKDDINVSDYYPAYPEGNERPKAYRLDANSEFLLKKEHDSAIELYWKKDISLKDVEKAVELLKNCLEYKQFTFENAFGIALINNAGWDISDDKIKLRIEYNNNTDAEEITLTEQNEYGGFNYMFEGPDRLDNISTIQFVYTESDGTKTEATLDANLLNYLAKDRYDLQKGAVWLFDNAHGKWEKSIVNSIYTVSSYEIEQENDRSFSIAQSKEYDSELVIHFLHDTVIRFTKDNEDDNNNDNTPREYIVYSGFYYFDSQYTSIDLFSRFAMSYFGNPESFEFSSYGSYGSEIELTNSQGKLYDNTDGVVADHWGETLNLLIGGTNDGYINTINDAGTLNDDLALTANRINFRWVRGKNDYFKLEHSVSFSANIITLGIEQIDYDSDGKLQISAVKTSDKSISYVVLMNDIVLHNISEGSSGGDKVLQAGTYAFDGSIDLLRDSDSLVFVDNKTDAYADKNKTKLVYINKGDEIYGN